MIVKGLDDPKQKGRQVFDLKGFTAEVKHFVIRTATADNPFVPHKHEQKELWYVTEGSGVYTQDKKESKVEAGDLIIIDSRVEHGLQTETMIKWICLG